MDQALIRDYRALHELVELPLQEKRTVALLKNRLLLLGFSVTEQPGLLFGFLPGAEGGRALCFHAQMSAQRFAEGGKAETVHAQGNDAACAMVLTAVTRASTRKRPQGGLSACFHSAGVPLPVEQSSAVGIRLTDVVAPGRAVILSGGDTPLRRQCSRVIRAVLGPMGEGKPVQPLNEPSIWLGVGAGAEPPLGSRGMSFRKTALELGTDLLEALATAYLFAS